MLFYVIAATALIPGALAGFIWHKRTDEWWRQFGAVMLVLLPVYIILGLGLWQNAVGRDHFMWESPAGEYFSSFDIAFILTFTCAPGWSLGVLCGYMFRSIRQRPLRF